MKDKLFTDLLASVEEAGAIRRGEQPARRKLIYKGKVLVEIQEKGRTLWSLEGAATDLRKRKKSDRSRRVKNDPKSIREALGQTQAGFAELLGVSIRTLQNWEQGRRDPAGPARRLLDVAMTHPLAVLEVA